MEITDQILEGFDSIIINKMLDFAVVCSIMQI